jgi:tRNA-splicing ligase RtcB
MMANTIKEEFKRVIPDVAFLNMINIHHNYAIIEHHYGRNVIVHRKGATLARENTIGIIPGSQGTASYIVQGLGNEASLCSCSHGAGRKMSRKKAQESLNLEEEKRKMDEKGILHAIRGKSDLDEAAGAYKDIDTVMEEQKDLVKILVKLSPLAVVKG